MKKLPISFFASYLLVMASCSKEPQKVSTPTTSSTYSLQNVFDDLRQKSKVQTIDAAKGGSFYGNSGTRYVFQPSSFQFADGSVVTGDVRLEVTEYLNNGDMIFSKMLPMSGKEPLISGGEINVLATKDGLPVYMRPNYYYQAFIPQEGKAPTGMSLFLGEPTQDSTVTKVNWVLPKEDSGGGYGAGWIFIAPGGGAGIDTLVLNTDSLKLCNADQFMSSPNYQDFYVRAIGANIKDLEDFRAYSIYDNGRGAWKLWGSWKENVNHETHVPDIPVHFVVFGIMKGKFYGGITGATPKNGETYTVKLEQTEATDFKKKVNDL